MDTELEYNPIKKHYLMLCELDFPLIHGECDNSIGTQYLVYDIFKSLTMPIIETAIFLNNKYNTLSRHRIFFGSHPYKHPIIRNYRSIISRKNYIKPEIGEYIILPTQEAVAILKTFWLRIVQRKWKKVFKQQQHIIKERCKIHSLQFRQTTGHWPTHCKTFPTLKGMLYNL